MTVGQEQSPRIQRKRARSRKAILDAAEKLFSTDGYQGVRVEAIAAAADVSVGAVYTHFGGKDDVFVSVATRILDHVDAYVAEALTVTDSPLEQVGTIGTAFTNLLFDHPFLARFLSSYSSVPGSVAEQANVSARVEALYGLLAHRLEAAIDRGEAVAVDPMLFAQFLVASWNGVYATRFQRVGPVVTEEQVAQCLEQASSVLLDGISTPQFRHSDGHTKARRFDVDRPQLNEES